jgi:hypothetical protein
MPLLLDYESPQPPEFPQPRGNSLAVTALKCGVSSGPIVAVVSLVASHIPLPEETTMRFALLATVGILGGAFVFSCIVRMTLSPLASSKHRMLANIGIAAPVVWGIVIYVLVQFALSQI